MTSISTTFPIPARTEQIIEKYALGLGAVGIPGGLIGPGADLAVIVPAWINMTVELAEDASHTFEKQALKKIVSAAATGIGLLGAGTKIAASVIGWLTAPLTGGLSLLVSAGANASLNTLFTYAYGRACARYFLQTDELNNADVFVRFLICAVGSEMGYEVAEETIREALGVLNA